LHVKIVPGRNDGDFIQHADDQINNGEVDTPDHELPGNPIGETIESYQGFKTVEVFRNGSRLYGEQLCEKLKVVACHAEASLVQFVFRLRTALGSLYYVDVDQWVYISIHENCGGDGTVEEGWT